MLSSHSRQNNVFPTQTSGTVCENYNRELLFFETNHKIVAEAPVMPEGITFFCMLNAPSQAP